MRWHVVTLLGVLLSLAVVGGVWMARARMKPPGLAPPVVGASLPIAETTQYTDVVLLLDQSGSMSKGRFATDPMHLRVAGSFAGIDFLASHTAVSQRIRFGLVNFGSAVGEPCLPLTDVSLLQGERAPQARQCIRALDLGDTNFLAALRKGVALLEQPPCAAGTGARPRRALILFTDGEPDDRRKLKIPRYFDELSDFAHHTLDARGIELFVIGIDAHGRRLSATLPYWRRFVPDDHLLHVNSMEEMKTAFNTIARRLWRLPAGTVETLATTTASVSFTVPPYQERLECFAFADSPTYELSLRRPDGSEVKPGNDPTVPPVKHLLACDQLTIPDPPSGEWSYQVRSDRPVRVVRNLTPLKMRLLSPVEQQPAGKPLQLAAAFTHADGTPVPVDPNHPVEPIAEVKMPGETTPQTVKFPPEQLKDGILYSEKLPLPGHREPAPSTAETEKTAPPANQEPLTSPLERRQLAGEQTDASALSAQVKTLASGQTATSASNEQMKMLQNAAQASGSASAQQLGNIEVNLKTQVDGQTTSEQPTSLPITPTPYLQTAPDAMKKNFWGNEMKVTSQVAQGGETLSPTQTAALMKDHQATAQLYDSGQHKVVSSAEMHCEGGHLCGNLPLPKKPLERPLLLLALKRRPTTDQQTPATIDSSVLPLFRPPLLPQPGPTAVPAAPQPPSAPVFHPGNPAWRALITIILLIIGVPGIAIVILLNLHYLEDLFLRYPRVYYWAEHAKGSACLDFIDRRERRLEEFGLRIIRDSAGLFHVRSDYAQTLFTADEQPVKELSFRDRLEVIVSMSGFIKVRLRLATHAVRISRPPRYEAGKANGKQAKWA